MAKDNMDAISITPGATVKVEHFKLGTIGSLEYNVQQEFDYRREALHTPQVINKPISSDTSWGLSGWTPANSLAITVPAGDLYLTRGAADIGGRRFIRTGDGSIESEAGVRAGVTANGFYYIRIKYVVSTDAHSYIAEATESLETNDNKYITLAYAEVTNYPTTPYNWTTLTDLRSSNTSLDPPVVFSGDTDGDVVAVLTVTQTGSAEQAFEVYGGDVTLFASGNPFKQVIYGNSTDAIEIHNAAVASGKLRAGTVADTLYVDNFDVATQLDVASLTFSTTVIANATAIGDLATITLAATGATMSLTSGSTQTLTMTNAGAGNLDISIPKGKITVGVTGSSIAGSTTIGGVVLNANDVASDKITLADTTNQIYLNSIGAFDGIITTASIADSDKTYTFPNTTGTVAVGGNAPMSVDSAGLVTHGTTAGYKHVPASGATNAVLMGDGSDGSTWDATPSVSTITATATGSSLAGSSSVGGVTLNSGAISGVTTLVASSYVDCSYLRAGSAPSAVANNIIYGNTSGLGQTAQIMNEDGYYLNIVLSSASAGLSTNGTKISINQSEIYLGGNVILASSADITPSVANNADIGTSTLYWRDIFCYELNYVTLDPSPWDHVDDLAIIESVRPYPKKKTSDGRPMANLSGLPKEIYDKKTKSMKTSELNMLLIGAIKQLNTKVEEQGKIIDALMDAS